MTGTLSAREVGLGAIDPATGAAWARLAAEAGRDSVFAAPGYVTGFARCFGDRAAVSVLLFTRGGTLAGLVPLMRCRVWRGPSLSARYDYLAGDARFLRTAPRRAVLPVIQISTLMGLEAGSLRMAFLAAPGAEAEVLAALPAALNRLSGWSVAQFAVAEDRLAILTGAAAAAGLPGLLRRIDRPLRHVARLRPSAEMVAEGSQKFRQNIRRAEKFAAEGEWRFETLTGPAVATALPGFADLAARSWKEAGTGAKAAGQDVVVPYSGGQRGFTEALVTGAADLTPVMVAARHDGQMGAAILGFVMGRELMTALLFQDSAAGRASLGRLSLHRMIDWAAGAGLTRIDLNSNAEWTERYADRTETLQNLVLTRPSPAGHLRARLSRWLSG